MFSFSLVSTTGFFFWKGRLVRQTGWEARRGKAFGFGLSGSERGGGGGVKASRGQ